MPDDCSPRLTIIFIYIDLADPGSFPAAANLLFHNSRSICSREDPAHRGPFFIGNCFPMRKNAPRGRKRSGGHLLWANRSKTKIALRRNGRCRLWDPPQAENSAKQASFLRDTPDKRPHACINGHSTGFFQLLYLFSSEEAIPSFHFSQRLRQFVFPSPSSSSAAVFSGNRFPFRDQPVRNGSRQHTAPDYLQISAAAVSGAAA